MSTHRIETPRSARSSTRRRLVFVLGVFGALVLIGTITYPSPTRKTRDYLQRLRTRLAVQWADGSYPRCEVDSRGIGVPDIGLRVIQEALRSRPRNISRPRLDLHILHDLPAVLEAENGAVVGSIGSREWIVSDVDAWGHSLRYRSPGRVYRTGWELYSVGANGTDEEGEGDDILVGDNCPVDSGS